MGSYRFGIDGIHIHKHLVGVDGHDSFPMADELTLDKISYSNIIEGIANQVSSLTLYTATFGGDTVSIGYAPEGTMEYNTPFEICFKQFIGEKTPADCRYIPGTMNQERGIKWSVLTREKNNVGLVYRVHEKIGNLLDQQERSLRFRLMLKRQLAWDRFTGRDSCVAHAGPC